MSSSTAVTVLVADDDEDIRALVAFTLRRAGFTVVTAHDGSSAFQRLEGEPFKLAVLDINMPNIDGFAVCSYIRHRSRMPVIMLSARDSDADIVHALEIGADDYIKKPFSPRTLIARVQALLRRSDEVEVTTIEAEGVTLDLERRTLEIADATARADAARGGAVALAVRAAGSPRPDGAARYGRVGPRRRRGAARAAPVHASPAPQARGRGTGSSTCSRDGARRRLSLGHAQRLRNARRARTAADVLRKIARRSRQRYQVGHAASAAKVSAR